MNVLKRAITLLLIACMCVCFVGCGDELDRFKAAGVYIIDYTGGQAYEYVIDHEADATALFKKVKELTWTEDPTAKASTSYLFLRFYDKKVEKEVLFTIYDNGSCCLSREYDVFYKVDNGRTVYIDLVEMYEKSQNITTVEKFKEANK